MLLICVSLSLMYGFVCDRNFAFAQITSNQSQKKRMMKIEREFKEFPHSKYFYI